jgi:hypothetical protein
MLRSTVSALALGIVLVGSLPATAQQRPAEQPGVTNWSLWDWLRGSDRAQANGERSRSFEFFRTNPAEPRAPDAAVQPPPAVGGQQPIRPVVGGPPPPGGDGANPFQVSVELRQNAFRVGDQFAFTVSANRDCQFLVYTVGPNDKVELHDPMVSADFMGDPLLRAGERRDIPIAGAPGLARIKAPAGPHRIGAVCSRDDLSALGITTSEVARPAQAGRRSFEFRVEEASTRIDRRLLGLATVEYDVQ